MRYLVDARDVTLLILFGLLSLGCLGTGVYLGARGVRKEAAAVVVIQRADSLMKDWVQRGCAPRTSSVP